MANLSIESQVTELSRDALAAMFANINDKIEITSLAERLSADLKAIAGVSCHTAIDRGVDALQRAALWDNPYSANDAVRSITRCVTNDEIERASIKFSRAIALELLEVRNG